MVIAALVAAVLVVLLGFGLSFFVIFSDNSGEQYTITLPGQGSAQVDASPDIGEGNRQHLQTVQVDRWNIQAVIANLQRPDSWFSQTETTYFYRNMQSMMNSQMWKTGERVRIEQLETDRAVGQTVLLTEKWLYLWSNAADLVRFPRGTRDEALYRYAPSYEDLLEMPQDAVLEGKLIELEGQLCLYAKTRDTLTGETEQWYILSENGLLIYADGMLDGKLTYQSKVTDVRVEAFGEEFFRLPDGTYPN